MPWGDSTRANDSAMVRRPLGAAHGRLSSGLRTAAWLLEEHQLSAAQDGALSRIALAPGRGWVPLEPKPKIKRRSHSWQCGVAAWTIEPALSRAAPRAGSGTREKVAMRPLCTCAPDGKLDVGWVSQVYDVDVACVPHARVPARTAAHS